MTGRIAAVSRGLGAFRAKKGGLASGAGRFQAVINAGESVDSGRNAGHRAKIGAIRGNFGRSPCDVTHSMAAGRFATTRLYFEFCDAADGALSLQFHGPAFRIE
jgi:hypothetical protein